MVAIIPNSIIYNKSAYKIRKYIIDSELVSEIIDYGSQKLFHNISVYCCIIVFNRGNSNLIYNNT